MSFRYKAFRVILPLIIVVAGVAVMAALIKSRPAPKKEVKTSPGALVRVMEVQKGDRSIKVRATGTAQPARKVTLIPQVTGRVVYTSPALVAGGFFKQGELMFRIEDIDYRLAADRAEAALVSAEYGLARIESQARVARQEWDRINGDDNVEPNPLVLYEPQLKDAKAALKSAEAALAQARLDLDRTEVYAPFNCVVSSEDVELGQYVRAGTSVASISGTDEAEIIVPLPLDELKWLEIPRGAGGRGAAASVAVDTGGVKHSWKGHVVRSLAEVDPKGRMMNVVVSVNDPYGLSGGRKNRPALAFGTFVDVLIEGKGVTDVITIPRTAFRGDSTVWTMDGGNMLRIVKVTPLKIERDEVILSDGLAEGDLIVLTTLAGAADGMKLRPLQEESGS